MRDVLGAILVWGLFLAWLVACLWVMPGHPLRVHSDGQTGGVTAEKVEVNR